MGHRSKALERDRRVPSAKRSVVADVALLGKIPTSGIGLDQQQHTGAGHGNHAGEGCDLAPPESEPDQIDFDRPCCSTDRHGQSDRCWDEQQFCRRQVNGQPTTPLAPDQQPSHDRHGPTPHPGVEPNPDPDEQRQRCGNQNTERQQPWLDLARGEAKQVSQRVERLFRRTRPDEPFPGSPLQDVERPWSMDCRRPDDR